MNTFFLRTESLCLRPVVLDDAEFIVDLRNQKQVQGKIHNTSLNVEDQRKWISECLQRANEYYWVIETLDGIPIGTTSLYNYDERLNQIELGRWVMLKGYEVYSLSRSVLLKDFAFSIFGVSKIVMDVVSTNIQVLKYHRFLGEIESRIQSGLAGCGEAPVDVIWFEETLETWRINRWKLLRFCGNENDRKVYRQDEKGQLVEIMIDYEMFKNIVKSENIR